MKNKNNTFEQRVKGFMGTKKFDKLPPKEKETIKKFSNFQEQTKAIYSNGSMEVYESLGIV
ncbi:MAG: hypothetical protein KGJ11_06100 [Candidatus Omnitrophica bacterium]|nr:hypothetical protein [Candidatus Omnitrophota bacterium]